MPIRPLLNVVLPAVLPAMLIAAWPAGSTAAPPPASLPALFGANTPTLFGTDVPGLLGRDMPIVGPVAPARTGNPTHAPVPKPRPAGRHHADAAAALPAGSEAGAAGDGLAAHELERLRASLEWAAQQGFMDAGPPESQAEEAQAGDSHTGKEHPASSDRNDPPGGADEAVAPPPPTPSVPKAQDAAPPAEPLTAMPAPPGKAEQPCAAGPYQPAIEWRRVSDPASHEEPDYLTALGRQRAGTIDLPQPAALAGMALFYLGHGLYREALALAEAMSPVPAALRDAALVLLGRGAEAGDELMGDAPTGEAACRPDAAVWTAALLNARGKREAAVAAMAAVPAALAAFPNHPRTALALEFAEAALDSGDAELARALLELAEPAPAQSVGDTISLLRGRLALAAGQTQRADWYFAKALAGGESVRRKSRLALLEHVLANGLEQPPWTEEFLRGVLFDYRGSPRLAAVALLAADLRVARGDFEAALAAIAATANRLPEGFDAAVLQNRAQDILADALTGPQRVEDALALQLFQDHQRFLADDDKSRSIRLALARRALAAGLPSAAKRALLPLAARVPPDPAVSLPMAEAALRTNRPENALEWLARAPEPHGADARRLREQALILRRDYREAAKLDPDTGTRAPALLWAAADWAAAAKAHARALATADAAPAEHGTLALRTLAAAYMSDPGDLPPTLPPDLTATAVRAAERAGQADAASALATEPLPDGMALPDAVAAALERSRQVLTLFPARQP